MRDSPIACRRCFGSRSRQRSRSTRTDGGVDGGSFPKSTGSRRTAASVSLTVSPWKSPLPVSISKSTTPNAQTSALLSTGFPRACSGAMYAAVPRITPAAVARAVSVGECEISGDDPFLVLERLREAEVEELDPSLVGDDDVRGLEVAVDDPPLVRRLERLGDLAGERKRFFE